MPTHPPLVPRGLDGFPVDAGGEALFVLVLGDAPVADARLTPAEQDVAERAARGATNAEIARARGVSVRTIENQIARVMSKLGATSRVDLARLMGGG